MNLGFRLNASVFELANNFVLLESMGTTSEPQRPQEVTGSLNGMLEESSPYQNISYARNSEGYTAAKTYKTAIYILGWYIFSMSISIYNKWMFGSGLGFKFPIFITAFHQFCLFLLGLFVLYFNPALRPSHGEVSAPPISRLFQIAPTVYMKQILPCSITSAGDIGLSNLSIMVVSLSLYTMLKTLSLIFVLIFGLLFKLEVFHWRLVVIVVIMTLSVVMMVAKPPTDDDSDNSAFGITLVLLASLISGLRWSFTQILLKNNPHTPNSIATIFYLSPAMCAILFIIGLIFEGWSEFLVAPIWEIKGTFVTIGLMIVPGILAFMMTLCEFKLLQVSQVITLSVAGIFKELLTIILSSIIFGDRLSTLNIIGLIITFMDILWYNWFRYNQAKIEHHYTPLSREVELRNF